MAFRILKTKLTWLPESERPASGEVLVIPANERLWMIAGPGLDIRKAHGKELEIEAVRQGPVEPGRAIATQGSPLGYRLLIHAVVMGQDFMWIPGAGRKAVASLLELARQHKATGMIWYPLYRGTRGRREEPAREMLGALLEGLQEGGGPDGIQMLYSDDEEKKLLHETFVHLLSHPHI